MAVKHLESAHSMSTAYLQFEPYRDPEHGMDPISRWFSRTFTYTDQVASVVSIHVPAGSRVLRVAFEASTAWTNTTAVVIGDGAAADGWMATGNVNPSVASSFGIDYNATYAVLGKKYETGDTIDISFAGIATAGTGKLFVEMISYNEEHDAE